MCAFECLSEREFRAYVLGSGRRGRRWPSCCGRKGCKQGSWWSRRLSSGRPLGERTAAPSRPPFERNKRTAPAPLHPASSSLRCSLLLLHLFFFHLPLSFPPSFLPSPLRRQSCRQIYRHDDSFCLLVIEVLSGRPSGKIHFIRRLYLCFLSPWIDGIVEKLKKLYFLLKGKYEEKQTYKIY